MSFRDWHVGMKVVCVNNRGARRFLCRNTTYTIAALGNGLDEIGRGTIYVALAEVPMPGPLNWRAERFRPVAPRKTDISIFTAMLTDARPKVPA
ncbi:MAG: hypothetical protein EOQ52_20570 [Mesorhizobium sp.]|uniref:hypothetical protein n=1 Tax=Mesorhizobium sp. TaxID=1871066 RepID=UPI000FE46708|nr:hypothetical protein [Mesorhizobium sp.]RWB85945.1 MAG: hypothetical protein EOQ52_20570 [Mesorhizobium sp.]